MKIISVVVPVYNEEENIEHFYKSIVEVFDKLDYEFELDFVDDGSKDRSREILRELEKKDSRVQSIFLANLVEQQQFIQHFQLETSQCRAIRRILLP